MGKIPGVFRVHDSLGVPRAPVRDAAPTREAIEAFYKNALRSSGSRSQATDKTKRMFDLADLKVDANGTVVGFKVADHARDAEAAPPTEARYNQGNRAWIATLPAGSYELETDGDLVRLNRTSEQGGHEFVLALPSGPDYSAEDDQAGTHVYAKPAGEPERVALSDVHDGNPMPGALARANERLRRFYGQTIRRPQANPPKTPRDLNARHTKFWSRP